MTVWPQFDTRYEGIPVVGSEIPYEIFALIFIILLLLFGIAYSLHPHFGLDRTKAALRLSPANALSAPLYGYSSGMMWYLNLQAFLLLSVCLYCSATFFDVSFGSLAHTLFLLVFVCTLWKLFKELILRVMANIFLSRDEQKLYFFHHQILFALFGISLYIPLAMFLLPGVSLGLGSTTLFVLYILYRFLDLGIGLRRFKFHIFYTLHLILYLCALEILPFLALARYWGLWEHL